jgi:pyruvate/2-oxoglutarate dehydrogenase complex dihydrolipoamide acyltransferase (E2) component
VGETVRQDEQLAEVENEKVCIEVSSPCDGVLEICVNQNDTVCAGTILGVVHKSTKH